MSQDEGAQTQRIWVRQHLGSTVLLAAVPITIVAALVAALGPLGDILQVFEAWVWAAVAAAFGVAAGWLIAVFLVPTVSEVEQRYEPAPARTRREFRRRPR